MGSKTAPNAAGSSCYSEVVHCSIRNEGGPEEAQLQLAGEK